MSFDLKLVESFVAVAETLSFSRAAERTNTVQSAISTHIKLLEEQVKRSLVTRGRGQPVALTAEGAAFLVQARRLLMLADQMARGPGSMIDAEPVRLGTTVTFALSVVPSALSAFASRSHAAPVTVRTARSHELLDLLEGGQIDVALILDQGAHPMRQSTVQAGLAWVASETFVQRTDAPLPLAFMDDARDLRRHAFSALDETGAVATSMSTHPDPIGMRTVIAAGLAITVLPRIGIASPLMDIAPRLGLPPLGSVPVSVYGQTAHNNDTVRHLAGALASQLQAS